MIICLQLDVRDGKLMYKLLIKLYKHNIQDLKLVFLLFFFFFFSLQLFRL